MLNTKSIHICIHTTLRAASQPLSADPILSADPVNLAWQCCLDKINGKCEGRPSESVIFGWKYTKLSLYTSNIIDTINTKGDAL